MHMDVLLITRRAAHRAEGWSVLLMAPTNETVERLNQCAQNHRIRHGELNPTGPHTTAGVYKLFAGDEIATRRNDRGLVTDRGEMVRNRAVWTVDHHLPRRLADCDRQTRHRPAPRCIRRRAR